MLTVSTPKVHLTVVANQGTEEMATTVQVGACKVSSLLTNSGMLRHGSPHNLRNLAKWHLKRIVLINRHETWQTVLAQWP